MGTWNSVLGSHLLSQRDNAHELMSHDATMDETYRISVADFISGLGEGSVQAYILLEHREDKGVAGGAASAGWNVRTLNSETEDTADICTLDSNQFTLPAGTYRIAASAVAYRVGRSLLGLWNDTLEEYILIGGCAWAYYGGNYDFIFTRLNGLFTLADAYSLELHQYIQQHFDANDLGLAGDVAEEIYAQIEIWRRE
jgi:hypothetical protein